MFRAVLPEILVDSELRERYYQKSVAPALAFMESHLAARAEDGHIRPVDYPLAARTLHAMIFGLLVLHLLGDQPLEDEAQNLPETLVSLLFEGLRPEMG